VQHRDEHEEIADYPMIELDGERVVEEIAPQRLVEEQLRTRRDERAVDQRPGGVNEPRAHACDKRAEVDLQQNEGDQRDRGRPNAARRLHGRPRRQALRRPHQRHIDRAGERQMRGEPVMRDVDALGQPGGHHPPADRALQRPQREDRH
jgi:hypothetical protein